ncbi:DUF2388 domain-containing protein [Pseudomonas lalucatii]|uniref:DUF2388 domain-containing protein n=1 Tax=Pseudomonas lalucatii TaxID=1424203 RepID=A0ABS5Q6R9_9PSED|nr:DUF2388 domain-containing protein [Pseudomonas lalucatii]MBS7664431.1 DUF2388 domain-containing protein [Pseudomonas lalucatii]MBS7691048.1 DUF2388 domain-containing protein [Pseudomonas lalucatii]MBS7725617.1 DUF2388 domain-containing protein [Pseudomonas lalucatii]QVM88764.1 DUF2388 domain-containing protein [Pseudomonas lalucatii]
MYPVRLFTLTALLLTGGSAMATSFVGTTDAIGNSLAGTAEASSDATSSLRDDKVVLAARDDAASFVASLGAIRGAHLEAALLHIRRQQPDLQADDLQLARAILSR